MWGITNGMLVSNVLVTSIEFAIDSTDTVIGVSFYDTNTESPLIGASAQNIGGHQWLLTWNTMQSMNGNYAVCAEHRDLIGKHDLLCASAPIDRSMPVQDVSTSRREVG